MTRRPEWGPSRSSDCGNRGWCFDAGGGTALPDRNLDGWGLVSPPIARPARWRHASRASRHARSSMRTRFSFSASSRRRRMSPLPRSGSALPLSEACGLRPRRCGCSSTGAASRSKKVGRTPSEQQRPDVLRRRIAWFGRSARPRSRETDLHRRDRGVHEDGPLTRGRAPCGERCRAAVPHGHWKTTTFTAGLRLSGMAAPMLLDGPMNGGRLSWPMPNRFSAPRASPRRHRRDGQPARPTR